MIQLLPSSYNQKRTIMLNYEVLAGIYPITTEGITALIQAEWEAWFHNAQLDLDGDIAGNLYNRISDITDLQYNEVNVPSSLWISDSTYASHPFKADIPLAAVRDTMIPDVMIDVPQQSSGKIAGVAHSGNGFVRIFASQSQATFTIPTIRVRKAVT